jgi:hypothetical protein
MVCVNASLPGELALLSTAAQGFMLCAVSKGPDGVSCLADFVPLKNKNKIKNGDQTKIMHYQDNPICSMSLSSLSPGMMRISIR